MSAEVHVAPERTGKKVSLGRRGTAGDPLQAAPEIRTQVALDEAVFRPFFKAGIAIVLTLGAAWGAALLLRIALLHSFTAVGIQEVNAHGHAQIFGWVGLFVMGFAYQMFPKFRQTTLSHPRLAYVSLGLMLAGIVLRSALQPMVGYAPWLTIPASVGSGLEVAAVALFIYEMRQVFRRSLNPVGAYEYYLLSALAWFGFQAIYEAVYFPATVLAADAEALVHLVSTWQAPMREIQIHGFAMLMILGVSQRILPGAYGFRAISQRRSLIALAGINVGLIGQCVGFVLMRTQGHVWAALWYPSVILMGVSALVLAFGFGLHRKANNADRSLKFIRTAYAWLFVSLMMLMLLPVYQFGLLRALAPESGAAQLGFSHAYYGAVRHAITVGFISLMIVGVASKVVPAIKGIPTAGLTALWLPYLLLNAGCFLRVSMQTLTDFNGGAFPVTGVSGLLEVTALALWGVHLWKLMNRPQAPADLPLRGLQPSC